MTQINIRKANNIYIYTQLHMQSIHMNPSKKKIDIWKSRNKKRRKCCASGKWNEQISEIRKRAHKNYQMRENIEFYQKNIWHVYWLVAYGYKSYRQSRIFHNYINTNIGFYFVLLCTIHIPLFHDYEEIIEIGLSHSRCHMTLSIVFSMIYNKMKKI